jgi:DNA-binding NtrC family response regulator
MARWKQGDATRPVLYQLCRAGDRFEVGDGPVDLSEAAALVVLGRGDPQRARVASGRLPVDDPWMSSRHCQLKREGGRFFLEDLGSTNGILINGEGHKRAPLEHGDLVETGRTFWMYLDEPAGYALPTEPVEYGTWSTWSPQLARQLQDLEREVKTNKHVLLSGPEGSGKGYLARITHLMSGRRGRLVHLDCNERRPRQLEVDLFGGAESTARLTEAEGGTLFLEHVDDLPAELQDRLVERVRRSAAKARLDVRLIASTRFDIEDGIAGDRLRPTLIELLSEVSLFLPGLDERRADLGLLLDDFLARARGAPAISREACRAVLRHRWRLHIKAFSCVIEAASVLAAEHDVGGGAGGVIALCHLPVEVVGGAALAALTPGAFDGRPPSVQAPLGGDDEERTSPVAERAALAAPPPPGLSVGRDADESELEATDPSIRHHGGGRAKVPAFRSDVEASGMLGRKSAPSGAPVRPPSAYHDLDRIERSYAAAVDPDLIVDALKKARGNVSSAARYLGKPRALVIRWMKEFQIDASRYRE